MSILQLCTKCPTIAIYPLCSGNDSSTSGSDTFDSETDSSDERMTSSTSDAIIDLDENLTTGDCNNSRSQSQHVVFSSSTGEQLSVNRCLVSNVLKVNV